MNTIIIKTQAEFDALPSKFEEFTYVYIQNDSTIGRICVSTNRANCSVVACGNASVVARNNASVVAWDNASVVARDNASVEACGNASVVAWNNASVVARNKASVVARNNASVVAWNNASVVAWDNASVVAWGNASVVARNNASVEACGNASVEAWDNASVVARNNASVEACGNASVVAWDNASVVAWGNASVVARGNASVVACDNASVVACDNASVVAWDNASVEAWGNVGVHQISDNSSVVLNMFAVCWAMAKGKVTKKSKNATIIYPIKAEGTDGWLESQGIEPDGGHVILFKRVSSDFKTQENEANETTWTIGKTLDHPAWTPKNDECGAGKFHACSRPYFCDEFRFNKTDKYIAIKINVKDLYVWPNAQYPHKVAFRKGEVLYVCDRLGKKVEVVQSQSVIPAAQIATASISSPEQQISVWRRFTNWTRR